MVFLIISLFIIIHLNKFIKQKLFIFYILLVKKDAMPKEKHRNLEDKFVEC